MLLNHFLELKAARSLCPDPAYSSHGSSSLDPTASNERQLVGPNSLGPRLHTSDLIMDQKSPRRKRSSHASHSDATANVDLDRTPTQVRIRTIFQSSMAGAQTIKTPTPPQTHPSSPGRSTDLNQAVFGSRPKVAISSTTGTDQNNSDPLRFGGSSQPNKLSEAQGAGPSMETVKDRPAEVANVEVSHRFPARRLCYPFLTR